MKKYLMTIMLSLSCLCIHAQTVTRNGNVFTEVSKKPQNKEPQPTEFIYEDSQGEQHLIYLSSTGKAFIWKTSKKTGKTYRQYLPEIGKQINPEAYKEEASTKKK